MDRNRGMDSPSCSRVGHSPDGRSPGAHNQVRNPVDSQVGCNPADSPDDSQVGCSPGDNRGVRSLGDILEPKSAWPAWRARDWWPKWSASFADKKKRNTQLEDDERFDEGEQQTNGFSNAKASDGPKWRCWWFYTKKSGCNQVMPCSRNTWCPDRKERPFVCN